MFPASAPANSTCGNDCRVVDDIPYRLAHGRSPAEKMHPNGVTSSLKLYDVLMNELVEPRGNASSAVPFPSQLKKDRCRCSRVTQGQVGGQQELLRARSGGGKNFDLGLAASQVTRNDAAEISKVIAEGNSNRTLGHGQEFDGALAVLDLSRSEVA